MSSLRGKLFRRLMKAMPKPDDVSFEQQRRGIERFTSLFSGPRRASYEETTVEDIPVLWITPPEPKQQVMLYFHGGAYTIGSHNTERMIAGYIALYSGARLLVPHYRLAPEHPFPAALEDALTCYRHLLGLGIPAGDIIIGGLSAGGGLTAALTLRLRELGEPLPRACVLLSPWLDLTGTAPSIAHNTPHDSTLSWKTLVPSIMAYAGEENLRNPLISPVFADLTGFPPSLIQVGELEILLDDSRSFAENARKAGCQVTLSEWPGMIHGWHIGRFIPEADRAVREVAAFMQEQWAAAPKPEQAL